MRTSQIFVTVDIVVFKPGVNRQLLLIQRKNEPYKGSWALPGGFVDEGEDLEDAAKRELLEETGIKADSLRQLGAFGTPGRDPRHHTVSVVFSTMVDASQQATAADDAAEADWFDAENLPALAFDHKEIIEYAINR